MKTKSIFFCLALASCFSFQQAKAQVDLAIGNVSAGYNSYDSNTGIIQGIYFDALNNDNGAASAFTIGIYLIDASNVNNQYRVYSFSTNGQSGNTVVTWTNINIDFNNTSGIPAGSYRLAVNIDDNNDITETDETNNGLYITTQGNDLSYNPSASSVGEMGSSIAVFENYPNPASETTSFKYTLREHALTTLTIYDLSGKAVVQLVNADQNQGQYTIPLNTAALPDGMYVCALTVNNETAFKKFNIVH